MYRGNSSFVCERLRRKVEKKLQENNSKVWNGMKDITGCKQRNGNTTVGNVESANEFNLFYKQSDCSVPNLAITVCPAITRTLPPLSGSSCYNFCLSSHHPLTAPHSCS